MSNVKSGVKIVDDKGRLTPEAISQLTPSTDDMSTVTTNKYQALVQCQVFLPSAQLVNIARGVNAINQTVVCFILNPGDVLTLSTSQTISIMPI